MDKFNSPLWWSEPYFEDDELFSFSREHIETIINNNKDSLLLMNYFFVLFTMYCLAIQNNEGNNKKAHLAYLISVFLGTLNKLSYINDLDIIFINKALKYEEKTLYREWHHECHKTQRHIHRQSKTIIKDEDLQKHWQDCFKHYGFDVRNFPLINNDLELIKKLWDDKHNYLLGYYSHNGINPTNKLKLYLSFLYSYHYFSNINYDKNACLTLAYYLSWYPLFFLVPPGSADLGLYFAKVACDIEQNEDTLDYLKLCEMEGW